MPNELSRALIGEVKFSAADERCHARLFTVVGRHLKKESAKLGKVCLNGLCYEEYDQLSRRIDKSGIQESCSVRNVLRARILAGQLISDEGEILLDKVQEAASCLSKQLYSLGPNRESDAKRQLQILQVLTLLSSSKSLQLALKAISRPIQNRFAEELIRETLQLPANQKITDAAARRAALSAWMTYLRQSVGSCFATAPAIVVHDEQPLQLLKDFQELLATGRLKRTYGGVEYSVPLSASSGAGDLRRQIVLPVGPMVKSVDASQSPGFVEALEAASVIDKELSLKERVDRADKLAVAYLNQASASPSYQVLEIEQLIYRTLLQAFSLTDGDIEEYQQKAKQMMVDPLLAAAVQSGGAKAGLKQKNVSAFLEHFENGKKAFKALADNALLKAWEFTLASFSEIKSNFTRWNLYASLGLQPNDKGGIGPALYEILQNKVQECNEKVHEMQFAYEQAYSNLKYMEARMRNASSEKEAHWMRAEYQSRQNEFYTLQEIRDDASKKAHRFANLYNLLIDTYDGLFPVYFQEVYDADMHEAATSLYDDSPAGFRLVYKHGRTNAAFWQRVDSHQEFIEALASFFVSTESEITARPEYEGIEKDVSEIVTAVVKHIRSVEFIESAFTRMALAHNTAPVKDPLANLDKIVVKPWVYTSGGSMKTLVSCYWRREEMPTAVERWVESPMELLLFFVDVAQKLPRKSADEFTANPEKRMLMNSPTHAFLLKPGYERFRSIWQNESFTYTTVRDQFVIPGLREIETMILDEEMVECFVELLAERVFEDFRHYFKSSLKSIAGKKTPIELRREIEYLIAKDRGLQVRGRPVISLSDIDAALYSLLPLFPLSQFKERLAYLLSNIKELTKQQKEDLLELYDELPSPIGLNQYLPTKRLEEALLGLLSVLFLRTSTDLDFPKIVRRAMVDAGYSFKPPILIADTNWVRDYFGFTVNPGTGQFELWRFDALGKAGSPMEDWRIWLNGQRKDPKWSVYNVVQQYTS